MLSALVPEPSPFPPMQCRLDYLVRFYTLLDRLENKVGGRRRLSTCHGRIDWPQRGIYFFMEDGESRTHTGKGSRIVRVGTHALVSGSQTTLWRRLSQHKGQEKSGGGNHRGSIFRLLVCITGGDAVVEIAVRSGRTPERRYDLYTGDLRPVRHGVLTIALLRLLPDPFSSQTIPPEAYRATLRVTR